MPQIKIMRRCRLDLGWLICVTVWLAAGYLTLQLIYYSHNPASSEVRKAWDAKGPHTPQPKSPKLESLSHDDIASLYHSYMKKREGGCKKVTMISKTVLEEEILEWGLCDDLNVHPPKKCVVFSLGPYDHEEGTFENELVTKYSCESHIFDNGGTDEEVSTGVWIHPLNLMEGVSLKEAKVEYNLGKKKIHILKLMIDVDSIELIDIILKSPEVAEIKQLFLDLRLDPHNQVAKDGYISVLSGIGKLESRGFKIFWSKQVKECASEDDGDISNCYRLGLVKRK